MIVLTSAVDTMAPPSADPWLGGEWDFRGRFHTGTGWASCCAGIREPSNAFPFSEWRHVHTGKHERTWKAENLKDGTDHAND